MRDWTKIYLGAVVPAFTLGVIHALWTSNRLLLAVGCGILLAVATHLTNAWLKNDRS